MPLPAVKGLVVGKGQVIFFRKAGERILCFAEYRFQAEVVIIVIIMIIIIGISDIYPFFKGAGKENSLYLPKNHHKITLFPDFSILVERYVYILTDILRVRMSTTEPFFT